MYCRECGKEIGEAKFCPYCGAQQDVVSHEQQAQTSNQGYQPIQDQFNNQSMQQGQYVASDDESQFGFTVLSFIIPIIGLVLYLVWNKEYPKKAKSCLNGLIAGVVLYVVMVCCLISFGIGAANEYNQTYQYFDAVVETVPYE